MFAIQTNCLSRSFGLIRAVEDLTLQVPQGIIFGFLGPNGAGKTTTINLLLGLLEATKGSAEVLGFDCSTQSDLVRKHTGVLFENSGLYERLSVKDNMEFYARIWRLPYRQRESRIHQLLEHFALWDRRDEIVSNLSRGMQRKLALARAFIHRPKLVFLDEPTSGLDPIAAAHLHDDLIDFCRNEEATIFLTTHNLPEAEKICSHVAIINNGRLLTQVSIDEIQKSKMVQQIEVVGSDFDDMVLSALASSEGVLNLKRDRNRLILEVDGSIDPASISHTIIKSGGRVEEFRRVKSSLEDVFVELIEGE
ncbi:MAG: ABC transporter ATP-binding protein [Deltaproteobacteria bacterium]|nr:ABC transporter ATP-binding protein [Deltaproteobacteria bacterium]